MIIEWRQNVFRNKAKNKIITGIGIGIKLCTPISEDVLCSLFLYTY